MRTLWTIERGWNFYSPLLSFFFFLHLYWMLAEIKLNSPKKKKKKEEEMHVKRSEQSIKQVKENPWSWDESTFCFYLSVVLSGFREEKSHCVAWVQKNKKIKKSKQVKGILKLMFFFLSSYEARWKATKDQTCSQREKKNPPPFNLCHRESC